MVPPMIRLTRLSGSQFVLNSDLIEKVDHTPDTLITLVDGKKYIVLESLDEVVALVMLFRSEVVALSSRLPERDPIQRSHLTAVPPEGADNHRWRA
jgi:flagellar protein FlbD